MNGKMIMTHWCIIIIASFWLCIPKGTYAGTGPKRSLEGLNGPLVQNVESTQNAGIFFAQNNKKKTSGNMTADGSEKADEDATKQEAITKEKNAQKNTKQLKPFVPTEKIPADQGVDFPYDI